MYFVTCPKCGDNLDPGEKCECMKIKKPYRYIKPVTYTRGFIFETQIDGSIKIRQEREQCEKRQRLAL